MQIYEMDNQLCLFVPDGCVGKMCQGHSPAEPQRARTSASSWRKYAELSAIPFQSLDLTPGSGNLLGEFYWELISPWRGASSTLNTGASRRDAVASSLSQILEAEPLPRYYLSTTACLGILRRARERGKELPPQLKLALMMQAGLIPPNRTAILPGERSDGIGRGDSDSGSGVMAFAANQRDEVRDLHDVSGALGAQPGMKQQTFVASGVVSKGNGECFLTPDQHTSLTGGGGQAGQGYPCVMTAELTAEDCLTPWDTQQERIFLPDGVAPTMAGADGGGGRNPAGLLFAAGFCAGASPSAGGIGYTEEGSPTLKAGNSGTNMVPSVLCLNDQGGRRMDLSEDISGSLRSQEKGHQPLVMATQTKGVLAQAQRSGLRGERSRSGMSELSPSGGSEEYGACGDVGAEIGVDLCPTITSAAGASGNNQPVLFENYGIDSRYTGPHSVAPTMSARYGTGGNNVPLVGQEEPAAYCIVGNVIDRRPENGGNGKGYQEDLAYTLTGMDRHAVYARQRTDAFCEGDLASTESARQYKDATDLVMQETVGALTSSDSKGPNSQYVSQDKCVVEGPHLIRRLTPLECERLQGFPDGWTDIPGASDSARYKALGNSVAIPCVEFIMAAIADAIGNLA